MGPQPACSGSGFTARTGSVTGAAGSTQTATVTLVISPTAQLGPVGVSVTTGIAGAATIFRGGTATWSQMFTVAALLPTITGVSQSSVFFPGTASGFPGETLTLTVTGTNLVDPTGGTTLPYFCLGPVGTLSTTTPPTTCSGTFGTATTVSVTGAPASSQTATVTLVISPTAQLGPVAVSVSTGKVGAVTVFQGGTASWSQMFTIAALLPTITSISQSSAFFPGLALGFPGQTLTLTVMGTNLVDPTGANTLPYFCFGTGTPSTTPQPTTCSGSFGTATTVSVTGAATSTQTATVTLVISPTAQLGPVTVSVSTGRIGATTVFQGGTASASSMFTFAALLPTITSISPSTARSAETLTLTIAGTNLIDPTGAGTLPSFCFGPGTPSSTPPPTTCSGSFGTATTVSVAPTATPPLQTATVTLVTSPTVASGPVNVSVT